MTSEDFNNWISRMLSEGRCKNMSHLARIMDINRTTLYAMMKKGGSKRDALACSALLADLPAFGDEK